MFRILPTLIVVLFCLSSGCVRGQDQSAASKDNDKKLADNNPGDKQTVAKNADDKNTDDKKTDDKKTVDKNTDDKKTEDKNTDDKNTDDKKTDDKKTDDKKTDDKQIGDAKAAKADSDKLAGGKDKKHKHTNRLAKETSPYLLLHAHNPVDWYPWGPEALKKAKEEKKLIFLSIGYSSCHWCHVMERESFMDEEIAAYMNKHMICIKVDREERPDVDDIYMTALRIYFQAIGSPQNGGWPLSMFLTPEGKPFFGGTYFPARDGDRNPNSIGFLTILQRIQETWEKEPKRLEENSEAITAILRRELERPILQIEKIEDTLAKEIYLRLEREFDAEYGGFGFSPNNPRRPKFPEPSNLFFLIDQLQHSESSDSVTAKMNSRMLNTTLNRLAMGGIRDHLGGGFHRYSVDRYWHIPHFEKMLYDNGQLATAYAEAYVISKDETYRRVIEEMLEFVRREMTNKGGGFYSALDAESEGEEGKFYRWEKEEVEKTLEEEQYQLFAAVYGLDQPPNFEEDYYAPQLAKRMDEIAKSRELSTKELLAKLKPARTRLWELREKRPRPLTDTKVLTSWNGLMIRGIADAGRVFEQPEHVATAKKAADFVLANLQKDGRLLRTYGEGGAKLNAYLSDYAFLINGLLALHRATDEKKWLEAAEKLQAKQDELFWDETSGGYYFTSKDHEVLLARTKRYIDSAQPSGNSVAAENLIQLAQRTEKEAYAKRVDKLFDAASMLLSRAPAAAPRLAVAWLERQRMKPAEEKEEKKPAAAREQD